MADFSDVLNKSVVCLGLTAGSGADVISALIQAAVQQGHLTVGQMDEAVNVILRREQSAPTAMPDGIALPHGRTELVSGLVCMIGIHSAGIDFGAPDGVPTRIFVQLLVPASAGCNHIHFLANLSRRLLEQSVREALLTARTREEVLQAILNQTV